MAQKPAQPSKAAPTPAKPPASEQPTPEWKKALYAPERVARWIKGEMTLQELHGITGPEMMEMAVTGYTMYEQGRYNQAKVIFEGLATLDPKEAYYRTALGAVHLAEGKLDEAVQVLDEALELDSKDLAAYVNRGEAFLRKGDLIKAALDFKKSVELDPQAKDPLTRRARALSAAVLRSMEEASGGAKGGNKPAPQADKNEARPAAKGGKAGKR